MSPRHRRYKLLLDEMLHRREKFPLLNNYHDPKHITHDFHKSGITDQEVIDIALKEKRIIITKNSKHFYKLCLAKRIDLINITETIAPEELDKKIMAILRKRTAKKMTGKVSRLHR